MRSRICSPRSVENFWSNGNEIRHPKKNGFHVFLKWKSLTCSSSLFLDMSFFWCLFLSHWHDSSAVANCICKNELKKWILTTRTKKMQLASSERCFRSSIASAFDYYPTDSGRAFYLLSLGGGKRPHIPIPSPPSFFFTTPCINCHVMIRI